MQTNGSICDVRNLSDPGLQWKAWKQDRSARMTVTLYWPIIFSTFHPRRRRSAHCPGLVECFLSLVTWAIPHFLYFIKCSTTSAPQCLLNISKVGFLRQTPFVPRWEWAIGGRGRDRAAHADATQSFQLKERRRALAVRALVRSPVFTLKNDKNVPSHSSKYARYICKFFSGQRPLHLVCKQLLDLLHYVLWHFQTFWNCTSSPRKDFYWRAHGKSKSRTWKIPILFHWRKLDSRFQHPDPMKQRRKCEILHERGLGLSRHCSAEQSSRALLRLFLFPFPKSWNMYRNNSMFCPGTKIVGWEHSGSSRTYRNLVISPVLRYWHRKGIQGSFPSGAAGGSQSGSWFPHCCCCSDDSWLTPQARLSGLGDVPTPEHLWILRMWCFLDVWTSEHEPQRRNHNNSATLISQACRGLFQQQLLQTDEKTHQMFHRT